MILKLSPWQWMHTRHSNPCLLLLSRHFISNNYLSYMDATQILSDKLKSFAANGYLPSGRALHGHLISSGFYSSTFLQNHLLLFYSNSRLIDDANRVFSEIRIPNVFSWNAMITAWAESGSLSRAREVFDEMPDRDTVSWNSIMSAYLARGDFRDAIDLFRMMVSEEAYPDPFSVSCAIRASADLGCLHLALQLHAVAVKRGFEGCDYVDSSLIDVYIKCDKVLNADMIFSVMENPSLFCWNSMIYGYTKLYGIRASLDLFNQMPEKDTVSWNTIVSLLSQHGYPLQSLKLFLKMFEHNFRPNTMTYASALCASASLSDSLWGRHLHARILKMDSRLDVYTGSGLVDLYVKCGMLDYARHIFNSMEHRNVVSWNSLISGVAQLGNRNEALHLFGRMRMVGLNPDHFIVATILGVCSMEQDNLLGVQLHCYAEKSGNNSSVAVGNALITMYARSGDIQNAKSAFDLMIAKDIISWTAMITAFSQSGDIEMARSCFNKMPERNVVAWNSMISTYIQNGYWEEGIQLYIIMLKQGPKPDWVTFTSLVSVCADSALSQLGTQVQAQVEKFGFATDVAVANSTITMYSKCGQVVEAKRVFDSISAKNLISWNSMMNAYAHNGQGREVIETFECMGCDPDQISFLTLLTGCSHGGLVKEGLYYFNSMMQDHNISPTQEHFTCLIDLLGRAQLLDQAIGLIEELPFEPNTDSWAALLAGCRHYGNRNQVDYVVNKLLELDVRGSGLYALMANVYSDSGKLESVADVRKKMRGKGIQKNPGYSWIEVNNTVSVFTAHDTSHLEIRVILLNLEKILCEMEDTSTSEMIQASIGVH